MRGHSASALAPHLLTAFIQHSSTFIDRTVKNLVNIKSTLTNSTIGFFLTLALVAFTGASLSSTHEASRPAAQRGSSSIHHSSPRAATNEAARVRASEAYGKLPLHFEANRGQAAPQVKYISRGNRHALYLTETETVLALHNAETDRDAVLRLKMAGANPAPEVHGQDELPGRVNYFRGQDRKHWQHDVPTFARVSYANVYPGIDAVYYGNQRQLEYDFNVAPGADPAQIKLRFEGAQNLRVDEAGDLLIETAAGEVRQHKPFVYQEIEGARREIASNYQLEPDGHVGFALAAYDPAQPLVIDPVLAYSSYVGATGGDTAFGVSVDADGFAYITGNLFGAFTMTPGAYDTTNAGQDVYVAKINPAGGSFVYATYISANGGNNVANDIAIDAQGNAYITGKAAGAFFPATSGAYDTTQNSLDAFVIKLNATGNALLYASYLGGTNSEEGYGIAVDSSGDIYVSGTTFSNNFPVVNGLQTTFGGGRDAFAVKLRPAGGGASDLLYSTYLGGAGDDEANAIAADAGGNLYLTGYAASANYPTTANAFDTSLAGTSGGDVVITKLNPAATGAASLIYSTFIGGSSTDRGNDILLDDATTPNIYITGTTSSSSAASLFPTTANAYDTTISQTDAFFLRLNPANAGAADLVYSTFIGGTAADEGLGIARDSSGRIYLSGATASSNFPTTPDAFQSVNNGGNDAFIVKLNPVATGANDLLYATLYGGASGGSNANDGNDKAHAIAVDAQNNFYIVGETGSPNLPVQNAFANQTTHKGFSDGFVAKFLDATANTFDISGRITNLSNGGANFANIAVQLTGTTNATRTTDASGNYSFDGLPAGGNYTVTPVRANYTFAPPSLVFNNLSADQPNTNFAATVNFHTVSGRITISGGPQNTQPLAGVNVTLSLNGVSNSNLQTVTTNANGEYAFDPQPAERNYAIVPTLPVSFAPYAFNPASDATGILTANVTKNFTATPLYTIGGRITDAANNPVSGVSVSASPLTTVTTNANGEYTLSGARPNTNYTVTPAKTGFTFTPPNRPQTNLMGNVTGADFSAASQTYTISGRITSTTTQPAGQPVAGVTVKLTGSQTAQTTTNDNGEYAFANLGVGGNYTVAPTLADHIITPTSKSANSLASNQTFDFTVAQQFDIRGIIKDEQGAPLSGVTLNLNGSALLTTTADGKFEFLNRAGAQTFTVKPTRNGFTFSPAQEVFALNGDRLDLAFTGTPLTFNISGTIARNDTSAPLGGLTVNLRNSAASAIIATTATAADGTYTFNSLPAGANYHVSLPPQSGFTFTPDGRTITNLQADQTAQNFAAVPTSYTISGRISDAGNNSLAGVTLTLTGTASSVTSANTTTDAGGNYSFNVPAGGNYTVAPARPDYTFNPASRTFNALSANKTGENFTGTLAYTISGTVNALGGGALSGVTVSLSGAASGTQTTDAQGQFTFNNLAPGGTYTVTPALNNFTFNPQSRTYGNLSASQTNAAFEAVSTEPTDLQITASASASEISPGADVTYTFTIRNNGPHSAANITLTDNLPASLTFISCAASQNGTCVGGNASGNNRTVTFPSLAVDATATVTLVARVANGIADQTVINNTAQVSATNSDTNAQNNSAPASFKVVVPAATANLSLGVVDAPDPIAVGGNLTYTLTVNNSGQADATNVSVAATLPANTTFVSATNGCTRAGNVVTCALDQINNGANRQLNIVVKPTAEGTLNFTASVSSDTSDPDMSNNTAQAATEVHPLGTEVNAGDVIISEFRTHGSADTDAHLDDFVELYNNTDAPLTVGPTDASGGWALVVRESAGLPVVRATIPKGTIIPARGHFLVTGAAYTLGAEAASDLPVAGNILDDGGIALFRTADPAKFSETNERLDAVGFSTTSDQMYREGAGLAPVQALQAAQSFARKLGNAGLPQDTGDNAADFQLVSKTADSFGALQSLLGTPGPENTASHIQRNATVKPSLVDPSCAGFGTATSGCARVREGGTVTNGAFGTLTIRRRFTNKTGAPINSLRFRITDVTTLGTPGTNALADLRAISSTDVEATVNNSPVIIRGTLLESTHPLGGGVNTTLLLPLTGNSLAPNASIDVQFRLGVERNGAFRFFVNVEALTANPSQPATTKNGGTTKQSSGK
jgi:uncharacterized repeat protein (TIGR01451 family)